MPTFVDRAALHEWPLPAPESDKYGRGNIVVIGGAPRSPGATMLAGLAALRVGAGRLTLAVGRSVASAVAVAVPESGVVPLAETADGHIIGSGIDAAASDLGDADAVLVGPGLDDADETRQLLERLPDLVSPSTTVVVDAYALGALPASRSVVEALAGRLVLTPNKREAALLLGRDIEDLSTDVARIAHEYTAAITCFAAIADPSGSWRVELGPPGLATSGSGDVLAGAVVGLAARGATPAQAAVWATFLHARAGERLAQSIASVGYLASEILGELPRVLAEVEG